MSDDRDRHGFRGKARRWAGFGAVAVGGGAVAFTLTGAGPAIAGTLQSATTAPSLVFDRVTVVEVAQGKLLPNQRVVIAGNRIQAMGTGRDVPLPKDAQVVNAQGKYLIPGLWDLHIHPDSLVRYFHRLFIANGVTGVRDAKSTVPLPTQIQWWREILAGTRVGPPRQLLAGSPEGNFETLKASGANFLKVYPFSAEKAAAARRVGLPFGGHVDGISAMTASDSGITLSIT